MGGSTDPYGVYQTRSTLDFKEGLMMHMMELLPYIGEVKLLRQWAGMTDMTPDFAPIIGCCEELDNFQVSDALKRQDVIDPNF